MRKKYFLPLILLLIITSSSFAQPNARFTGSWEGKLNVGVGIRVVFHIMDNGKGALVSTSDSPDQGGWGIKCDTTITDGDKISIEIKIVHGSFEGRLIDDTTIEGKLIQGQEFPLILIKTLKPPERNRPQTPKPPFPYTSEDIIYSNKDNSIHYGATITIPPGKGPFPTAILITGSGAENRDEDIFGHKPFAVLADALSRRGFIVLRVDDRGVGKSTPCPQCTSADFANDVSTGLDYLLSRPDVDKTKLGMIGHSEGGMIAPIVANHRTDINFIVMLAGPGVRIIDLMTEQNIAVLRSSGVRDASITAYAPLYKEMMKTLIKSKDNKEATKDITKAIDKWVKKTDKKAVEELGFDKPETRNKTIDAMVKIGTDPWFKYFISFNPAPYLENLHCKLLALNGDKDIQVISKQNLPGIEAALKKSKSPSYEVKELPGLNHLFQTCKKCSVEEYSELEETFSPTALQILSEWLLKNVK